MMLIHIVLFLVHLIHMFELSLEIFEFAVGNEALSPLAHQARSIISETQQTSRKIRPCNVEINPNSD